jgi:hypothetical protein
MVPEGALTLEQHFLDDDLCEDVVVCRLSDNVRVVTRSKRRAVVADICRYSHTILVHQWHSFLGRTDLNLSASMERLPT